MKIFVASDIHGDADICAKVLEKYREEGADRLLLLGDILYHGPRNDLPSGYAPKKVIEMLNNIKDEMIVVRGNCDTEVDQMVLQFPILADYIYIISGETEIFCTHGHKFTPDDHPYLREGSVFLSGHTHITTDETRDGIRYMNPGSPSIPKGGTVPSYIVIENGELTLKRL